MKTKTYLIGDPAVREKWKRIGRRIGYSLLALIVGFACWATGYLWGLTCFYYG